MIPTPKQITDEITEVYQDDDFQDFFTCLFWRWQDEKEFEDIKEYQKAVQNRVPEGWTVTGMTGSPFRFSFTIASFPQGHYRMFVTRQNIGWERLKK